MELRFTRRRWFRKTAMPIAAGVVFLTIIFILAALIAGSPW
jgi:hypothetical protein